MRLRQDGHEELQVHGPSGVLCMHLLLMGGNFVCFAQESKGFHSDMTCTMLCEATALKSLSSATAVLVHVTCPSVWAWRHLQLSFDSIWSKNKGSNSKTYILQ